MEKIENKTGPVGTGAIVIQTGDNPQIFVGVDGVQSGLSRSLERTGVGLKKDLDILQTWRDVVPLVGRAQELKEMLDWLDGDGMKARVVWASGGTGKTRFAREVLKELAKRGGWDAGFLSSVVPIPANVHQWVWGNPTLVVVDDAESRLDELKRWMVWLAGLIGDGVERKPLRILLLERHASTEKGWLKGLLEADWQGCRVGLLFEERPKPYGLKKLAEEADRFAVLQSGLRLLAEPWNGLAGKAEAALAEMERLVRDAEFRQSLMTEQWGDPLFLLMAAIQATYTSVEEALLLKQPELARELAKREVKHIQKGARDSVTERLRVHTVVCANLCGGLTKEGLLAVMQEECRKMGYSPSIGPMLEGLAQRIGEDGRGDWVLRRYSPDWLAEAFLLEAGCDAGTVRRMAKRDLAAVVQLLKLTAQDFEAVGEHRPVAWLGAVLEDGGLTLGRLEEIETALDIRTPTTALRGIRVKLYQRMLKEVTAEDMVDRARLLNQLSNRQSEVGDRDGALGSIREAVEIYRGLYGLNADAFASDLARSLNNLSTCQSEVGDRDGALGSIREAVAIRRRLYGLNGDAFAADLAMSLNNLSGMEGAVGDRDGALGSIRESVAIYRGLYGLNADAFASYLASSLNNLSLGQSDVGDREGALRSIRESVAICRGLYGLNADAFASDLASSLNNLSNVQSDAGDRAGALGSIREAVGIYRGLYGLNADAFAADLAMSLNNLSTCESAVGDREGALRSIRESVEIRRGLYGLNADAFASDLARSLSFLGDRLDESGEKMAARDAAAESLRVLRPVYEAFPGAVEGLARLTVVDYARRSEELGLEVEEEVVGPYWGLFAEGTE